MGCAERAMDRVRPDDEPTWVRFSTDVQLRAEFTYASHLHDAKQPPSAVDRWQPLTSLTGRGAAHPPLQQRRLSPPRGSRGRPADTLLSATSCSSRDRSVEHATVPYLPRRFRSGWSEYGAVRAGPGEGCRRAPPANRRARRTLGSGTDGKPASVPLGSVGKSASSGTFACRGVGTAGRGPPLLPAPGRQP